MGSWHLSWETHIQVAILRKQVIWNQKHSKMINRWAGVRARKNLYRRTSDTREKNSRRFQYD